MKNGILNALAAVAIAALVGAAPPSVAAQTPSASAVEAQRRLAASATIERSRLTGLARFVRMKSGHGFAAPADARTPEERARAFFAKHGPAFGVATPSDLHVVGAPLHDRLATEHVRFQQWHRGLPVTGAESIVHLQRGSVVAVNGRLLDDDELLSIDLTPTISAPQAQQIAHGVVEAKGVEVENVSAPRLELFNRGLFERRRAPTRLAWFAEVRARLVLEYVWVDALTGEVLRHFNQQPRVEDRRVHDAAHGWDLPGTLVRAEGQPPTGDADADAVYLHTGDAYGYFSTQHGRDSHDGMGGPMLATVHYADAQSTSWNGGQMVFGDGFPLADDVVGHEFAHAVVQYSASFFYDMQSGALGEAFADIFGESIDLLNGRGTDTAETRWLIGEDLPTGGPLRGLADPAAFGHPGRTGDPLAFCDRYDPETYTHTNSSILAHAYALMVDGGEYNGQRVSGIGIEKAGRILYRALTSYLMSMSDFEDADTAIRQSCTDLIAPEDVTAVDCLNVSSALDAVELRQGLACEPGVTVNKQGIGSGRVLSDDGQIDCGTACEAWMWPGMIVTLTASAEPDSVFTGWEGVCTGTAECQVTVTEARQHVTATFEYVGATQQLTVSVNGPGKIESSPTGIDCGAECLKGFPTGSTVILSAVPEPGQILYAWNTVGCTERSPTCVLAMDQDRSIEAYFSEGFLVSVSKTGAGRVLSGLGPFPDGPIDCGERCQGGYYSGEWVMLRTEPSPGWVFAGWSGPCSGTAGCEFALTENTTVMARFESAPFAEAATVESVGVGAAEFGDYDGDGDLDLLVSGLTSMGDDRTRVLLNNAGAFTDTEPFGNDAPRACWVDFDRDGDLDIHLQAGEGSNLYRNDYGSFVGLPETLPAGYPAAWGDYDNDGDLDVLLGVFGGPPYGNRSTLYRNDGGVFVDTQMPVAPLTLTAAAWGDYDNDGDLDLVVAGLDEVASNAPTTYLLRNDGGVLTPTGQALVGVRDGALAWADFDADGDLDLAVGGCTPSGGLTQIYRNDGGTLTEFGSPLPAACYGSLAWGDYDADGRPDLLIAGIDEGLRLYRNTDGGFVTVPLGFDASSVTSATWGDYDNDGRLDIVALIYEANNNKVTKLFRNQVAAANTPPTAPGAPIADASDSVALRWTAATDIETPADGLTYNVRVGTTPDGSDVVSPMSDPLTGFRRTVRLGNARPNMSFTLRGLAPGQYYWAVQAVDASHAGSAFSEGGEFAVSTLLSVATQGGGSGIVTSQPVGISCGGICNANFGPGTTVVLTATPQPDSIFLGWSGACSGTEPCTVVADGRAAVGALFGVAGVERVLSIETIGAGQVISSPQGIDCRDNVCTATWPDSTVVALTTNPDAGSVVQWGEGCPTGAPTCVVVLDADRTVRAEFFPGIFVSVAKIGNGRVVSDPAGIDCGRSCASGMLAGQVWLSAVPDPDWVFAGWGGACSGTDPCELTQSLNGPLAVTAQFDPAGTMYPITVAVVGSGTVTSPGGAINCDSSCTYDLPSGYPLILAATGAAGYGLHAWGGDCVGHGVCGLTLNRPTSLTATFGEVPFAKASSLAGVDSLGASTWGDYDGDGDLDLVVVGMARTGAASLTRLYRNDVGVLVDSGVDLLDVSRVALWGDYDNDGDLDLLLGGWSAAPVEGYFVQLYRNDGGVFVPISAALPTNLTGVNDAAWGDYDNDGDLDLALTGVLPGAETFTRVYRNDRGTFVDADARLASGATVAWGDYDHDGDLDLLVAGDYLATHIYRNYGASFVDIQAGMVGAAGGRANWLDYDGDGDLDVVVSSVVTGGNPLTRLYRNDDGVFSEIVGLLPEVGLAPSWGDYDGDGDSDALFTGFAHDGVPTTVLYRNDGGSFADVPAGLPALGNSHSAWADYDGDGRLDLVLSGIDYRISGRVTEVYRNLRGEINAPPSSPSSPHKTVADDEVDLSWAPAIDDETTNAGLTYNVRVGTTFAGSEIVSAMADGATGLRRVAASGNAGTNTFLKLRGLSPGRYYWAVQAIDTSFAGSAFADGGELIVPTPGVTVSVDDVRVTEGNSGTTSATFTVTLSAPAVQEVTVAYATGNGSATAGSDYVAQAGILTFAPGETAKPISVLVNGDVTVELDETFLLRLNDPVGATLVRDVGTGTIISDEPPPPPTTEEVIWTHKNGVRATGNDLRKTASTRWGNAGAVSTRAIVLGDGYVEFVASEARKERMLGLSHGDHNAGYTDIDFAVSLGETGVLSVYEGGVSRGSFGSYAAGDVIRVSVTAGIVRYSRNSTVVYTSTRTPTYPLLVDTALKTAGATLKDVMISGGLIGSPARSAVAPTP